MQFQHIYAVFMRYILTVKHDANRFLVALYWPLLDVVIWGFLGSWMVQEGQQTPGLNVILLTAVLLWMLVGRMSSEVQFSLLEELWSHNIVSLFASPLRFSEWLCGTMLYAVTIISIVIIWLMAWIGFLFGISFMITVIKIFMLCSIPLVLSGFWVGFIGLITIITFGKRAQELGFVLTWSFMPFVSAFYPIAVLPTWGQKIGYCLPMTYAFEAMRGYITHGKNPLPYLAQSCTMSIIYGGVTLALVVFAFNKSKEKGLVRLLD